ncbi:TlpA family protein disulfide reductase [Paenibacillus sp. GCM10027626]|uniref:TlpA family protein disulfide reductase n=1 Tax=Paenibacillus sp. GCM10027626 TaxID=3273411 RepID=UPI0036352D6E
MKRTVILLVVIAALALAAIYQNKTKSDEMMNALGEQTEGTAKTLEQKAKAGFLAPQLSLPNLNDEPVALGGEREQMTLINFWASWCGPCELEAPDLQQLAEKYEGRLLLLGVNATSYDKERQAREFVEEYGFTFPILMDREGKAADRYVITSFPTSLLVDKSGVVKERITGVIPLKEWHNKIGRWLAQEDKTS